MKKELAVIIIVALGLVGCSSNVKRMDTVEKGHVYISKQKPITGVSIKFNEEAKEQLADNLKFDQNKLLGHVKRAMDANLLLNSAGEKINPHLVIEIKGIRVRSNFSAVMWGFMAGADYITGDIILEDPAGNEINRFEVSVSYALGGFAGGQDDARMGWLYEKFAEKTVNELMGKET